MEASLRAMKLDYIDLYQVHWPDEQTPFEDPAGYLQEMVDEGKIRHVGVSNYDVPQMEAFERGRPVETLQPPYHLFRQSDAGRRSGPTYGPATSACSSTARWAPACSPAP